MATTKTAPARLLSRAEAAEYLGVETTTLEKWAVTGRYGLKFIKVGRRAMYRVADLDKWIESRGCANTGEGGELDHPDADVARSARNPNANGKRIKK